MMSTSRAFPVAVNISISGPLVVQPGWIDGIVPISLTCASVAVTADVGATETLISGVATLRLLLVTSYVTLSILTLITGSLLMLSSSGFSFIRSTCCDRLMSSDISQESLVVLQVPVQPIGHAAITAELHTDWFALHDTDFSLPSAVNRMLAFAVSTFQLLASIVNFLSGNVRSKLVTSELISPQPAAALQHRTATARRKVR